MSKLYTSTSAVPFQIQRMSGQEPIEDRSIVQFKTDLMAKSTWGHKTGPIWKLPIYVGMQVLVTEDQNRATGSASNNGVYWLKKLDGISLMNDNPICTDDTFSEYWERIGTVSDIEYDDNTLKKNPTRTDRYPPGDPDYDPNYVDPDPDDDNQLYVDHVERVWGGNW